MSNILFFGYGANRDKKRIVDILEASGLAGEDLEIQGGKGARIDGAVLSIQTLDQVPMQVRDMLQKVWGDKFRAYTLKPGNGQIAGVVWELTQKQYDALKEWELVGVWRELTEVEAITSDLQRLRVCTDKASNDAVVKEIVDGLNYESNLNKEGMRFYEEDAEDEYRVKELLRVREDLKLMIA